jgi:hypothetical protein
VDFNAFVGKSLSWLAAILVILTGSACAARAQETFVIDTYTCAQFLADVGDRADAAKVRSLMMISWAAGYAAARQKDGLGSREMIAAALGDVCRNAPAQIAAKAITDKINELASRDASLTPSSTSTPPASSPAPAMPSAPVASQAPNASPAPPPSSTSAAISAPMGTPSGERSFTSYSGRDMEGGDYHKQRGVSSDQCEKFCRRDSRCQAYSYDAWNHYCFLKSALGPLRLEPRSVTYVASGAAVSYDAREPIIQRRMQKSFPNEAYLQANAQSYGDCAQRCLRDKRCEAFNFYIATRRCNLIEKPREYSDDRGADVGIKVQAAQ